MALRPTLTPAPSTGAIGNLILRIRAGAERTAHAFAS